MAKTYELGKLTVSDHESKTLTGAFGLQEEQFDDIVNTAREAWNYEDTVSESVEFLVKKLKNSELVLGLLILGRIWEENSVEEDEDDEDDEDAEE
ncbi:MAG: hypothetical protein ACFFD8_06470 [Candidatus Thorarchaeota archaeon]